MARFLFFTWDGAGNQPPAVAIAQALTERGHAVTVAGYENQAGYFTSRGIRFVLLQRSAAAWRDAGADPMFDLKLRSVWASIDHLHDVPTLISRERCDALVMDCLMFGVLAAAEQAGVPAVTLVHSAPGALMPPKGQFESLLLAPVNAMRVQAGVPAVERLWDAWARFPAYSNSIRQLDPLAEQALASFCYVGPFAERVPPSGWTSPWSPDDRRPLVLMSFSTGPYWDQGSRIQRSLQALSRCNCRVLVTAGPANIAPDTIPDNASIVARVPHDEVLPNVAVTITHAGHGTVTASLKHGVPLLSLPNPVADQPILAAQVEALGAGRVLDGERATPAEIGAAIGQLLADPSYAANARLLAHELSRAAGVSTVIARLEQLAKGRH